MVVLIVDDNDYLRQISKKSLQKFDSSILVLEAKNGLEAIETIAAAEVDFAFVDEELPDINGSLVLEEIRRKSPETILYGITGNTTINEVAKMVEHGARRVFFKPLHWDEIFNLITT